MTKKTIWVSGAVVLLLVANVGGARPLEDQTIQITEQGFKPVWVEVVVGQKIIFQNLTQNGKSVASIDPSDGSDQDHRGFASCGIEPGISWETTFTKEGSYYYSCKQDPTMLGTIMVNPSY